LELSEFIDEDLCLVNVDDIVSDKLILHYADLLSQLYAFSSVVVRLQKTMSAKSVNASSS